MPILTKKITLKMNRDVADELMKEIDRTIASSLADDDNDKMLFITLNEVSWVIYRRLSTNIIDFSIIVPANQALALRIFYNDFVCDPTTYLGNNLHRIANMVHKQLNA